MKDSTGVSIRHLSRLRNGPWWPVSFLSVLRSFRLLRAQRTELNIPSLHYQLRVLDPSQVDYVNLTIQFHCHDSNGPVLPFEVFDNRRTLNHFNEFDKFIITYSASWHAIPYEAILGKY